MKVRPISIRFNQQKGFSLLEALLSIVIILAAGLGVVELFISADKKNKLSATVQIAQQMASAATQLLSASYDPNDTITTADIVNSGLLPQNVVFSSSTGKVIKGPYGTFDAASITTEGSGTNATAYNTHEQFSITANNLPIDQAVGFCQAMIGNFALVEGTNTYGGKVSDCNTKLGSASGTTTSVTMAYPRANFISTASATPTT